MKKASKYSGLHLRAFFTFNEWQSTFLDLKKLWTCNTLMLVQLLCKKAQPVVREPVVEWIKTLSIHLVCELGAERC